MEQAQKPQLRKVELQYYNHKEMKNQGFDMSDFPEGESWVLSFEFENGARVRMGVNDIRQSQEFSLAEVNDALETTMNSRGISGR